MYIPEDGFEFAKGLIKGTLQGSVVAAKELIPSTLSCCRGILYSLWAFVSDPAEISQEMVHAAYAIGEYIASHEDLECLGCVVPELKELSSIWHKLNDYSKGKKLAIS